MPVSSAERTGFLAAAFAAILFGAAYPVTAIALRSFHPLALAAIQGTLALGLVVGLVAAGLLSDPRSWNVTRETIRRLVVLGLLGGIAFAASMNIAVSLAGSTITGFVATLYAVLATLFAVPLLGERIRPHTVISLAVALVGTVLLAGFDPLGTSLLGTLVALGAAVAFALYLVLARRWGAGHALDGTLVTIAILAGRGPVLLLVELDSRARSDRARSARSGCARRPGPDRAGTEHHRPVRDPRQRQARARPTNVCRPAAHAARVRRTRRDSPRRATRPGADRRCRTRPRGNCRRQRRVGDLGPSAPVRWRLRFRGCRS